MRALNSYPNNFNIPGHAYFMGHETNNDNNSNITFDEEHEDEYKTSFKLIDDLNVGAIYIRKLKYAKFVTVEEVAFSNSTKVSQAINIPKEEAITIQTEGYVYIAYSALNNVYNSKNYKTAIEMLRNKMDFTSAYLYYTKRANLGRITTGSDKLDALLGGGIKLGETTEIIGTRGAGKTQLCHSLSVACQVCTKICILALKKNIFILSIYLRLILLKVVLKDVHYI